MYSSAREVNLAGHNVLCTGDQLTEVCCDHTLITNWIDYTPSSLFIPLRFIPKKRARASIVVVVCCRYGGSGRPRGLSDDNTHLHCCWTDNIDKTHEHRSDPINSTPLNLTPPPALVHLTLMVVISRSVSTAAAHHQRTKWLSSGYIFHIYNTILLCFGQ